MSDAEWKDTSEQLLNEFECLVPCVISNPRDESLLRHFDRFRGQIETMADFQRRTLVTLMAVAFEMGDLMTRTEPTAPPTVKTDSVLARQLFDACTALLAGTPAEGPLPGNPFLVTRHNELIGFTANDKWGLAPSQALLLGVWLIALSDPTLSDAAPMLLRVATR